ncbi:MAG: translation initiation factor IF-2 [Acidobacteria bacterium]|nr:translation initiation factor IF-2 [Acidobacteriota bacterium]
MSKIRINDLARELEVKANAILSLLPALGVTEKKTHSSSVDEDVAEKVRRHFQNGGGAQVAEAALPTSATAAEVAHPAVVEEALKQHATIVPHPISPLKPPLRAAGAPFIAPLAKAAPPAGPPPPAMAAEAVAEPLHPPVPAVKPIPAAPATGQPVATGPRTPMPAPSGPPAIGMPPRPAGPGVRPALAPGQAARPLAGQPPLRPVVPPRPDLAPKLQAAAPGMPAARKPLSPTPGQPIFQRPVRPGMPTRPSPGASRPGMPMARGAAGARPAPRPMHPTSRTPRVGAGIAPPTGLPAQQRRPQHRPGYQRAARDREAEQEAKILQRRTQPRVQAPEEPPPITRDITVSEGITVKELSEKLGVKASAVQKKLVDKGVFATINQTLDQKTINELAAAFGASTSTVTFEEEAMQDVQHAEEPTELVPRAPVVTIMGHVDHGKTSLLDAIRETEVAAHEAGGITQAIGAYQVEHKGRKIVFIDTPGHEAFTRMRYRGAKVTDLVVLVVAADDGVMPQTLEAIDHARAAKVPILVAINKIDKPDAQPERVKQQLADRGLLAEDWGGETVMVPVSAKAKTNLDLLLEMILLMADIQENKANPTRPAMGTVLEAKLDRGQGPVATVLVQNGTLRVGEFFIVGQVFGKVRAMLDDRGRPVKEAPPSTPVIVLGLEDLPAPGDSFQVVTDTAKAKQIVTYRESKSRELAMAKSSRMTLEALHEQMRAGDVKELYIILKCDVTGSVEVLSDTLTKLSTDKVKMRVLHSGVGAISESDVLLAAASNAIIVGFSVRPERTAAVVAEKEKVDIRLHTVIYDVTDEIKRAMTGLLEPVIKEIALGRADVRETFRIPKVGAVAGCIVQDGKLTRDAEVRLLRDNVVVYTGKVASLRRFKDDVSEVKNGFECGVTLSNFSDIKQGDVIEAFVTEKVAVLV